MWSGSCCLVSDVADYCRQVEAHLTRINGGHMVRVVGAGVLRTAGYRTDQRHTGQPALHHAPAADEILHGQSRALGEQRRFQLPAGDALEPEPEPVVARR